MGTVTNIYVPCFHSGVMRDAEGYTHVWCAQHACRLMNSLLVYVLR